MFPILQPTLPLLLAGSLATTFVGRPISARGHPALVASRALAEARAPVAGLALAEAPRPYRALVAVLALAEAPRPYRAAAETPASGERRPLEEQAAKTLALEERWLSEERAAETPAPEERRLSEERAADIPASGERRPPEEQVAPVESRARAASKESAAPATLAVHHLVLVARHQPGEPRSRQEAGRVDDPLGHSAERLMAARLLGMA